MSFLPGMFPGGAAAARPRLTTLTQVLSATDNDGAAFTLPSGIQAGDLIVVFDHAGGNVLPATAVPANFTSAINANNGVNFRAILSYKIAVGTESGASVNGMDGNVEEAKLTYVFRGDVPITAVVPTDPASEITTGNPTAQVVNASGGTPPLVVIGGYSATAAVNPRTFSPAKDGEINVAAAISDVWLAYKIYNSNPADVTVDMDDEQSNTLLSCYFACS